VQSEEHATPYQVKEGLPSCSVKGNKGTGEGLVVGYKVSVVLDGVLDGNEEGAAVGSDDGGWEGRPVGVVDV
jgi:hypothetical protein